MLCPTSNSNYVASNASNRRAKSPDRNSSSGEYHFTPIRDLFLAGVLICLMLNFGHRLFTQGNQLSAFKSGASGLIDILTSDDPQPLKPMVPLPPPFAYIKGLGEAPARQIQSALSARVFRMKEIDPNEPLYGVGPDVTNPEPTLAAAPDLTGTGIVGAVPVAQDIANLSFVIEGIAGAEKHIPAPHDSASLVSLTCAAN